MDRVKFDSGFTTPPPARCHLGNSTYRCFKFSSFSVEIKVATIPGGGDKVNEGTIPGPWQIMTAVLSLT